MSIKACKESYWEHVLAYTCTTLQPIKINPAEILEGRYWPLEEINQALAQKKLQFTSTFNLLFINYIKENG